MFERSFNSEKVCVKKTARLLDSGVSRVYISGVGAGRVRVRPKLESRRCYRTHAGVPRLDKNLMAAHEDYRPLAAFRSIPPCSFKNCRCEPEYKSRMYLGLHHRAGPTLNARASALSFNIPPKAFKKCGERQGSREAKSANYAQDTGLSGKYRHSLARGVRYGGRAWEI